MRTVKVLADNDIPFLEAEVMQRDVSIQELEARWGNNKIVVKPVHGIGQGKYCFRSHVDDPDLGKKIRHVPGDNILFQLYADYQRIFRITVVNGIALDPAGP